MKYKKIIVMLVAATGVLVPDAFAKDSDVEARGALVALSSESVTVGSLTCNITSGTEYKDQNDIKILPSAFKIGDNVKLKCRGTDAKELELKTGDDNTGGGDDNGGNNGGSNGGGSGTKPKEVEIEDKPSKSVGVSTTSSGKVEYRYKREDNGRTEISFKSTVKVTVPSTVPLVTNTTDAAALNISLTISRNSAAYAVCDFVFNRVLPLQSARTFAEYKIDIREKRGSLQNKKGSCDSDLLTDGIQAGIPELKKGDTYTISDEIAGVFLQGTI